MNWCYILDLVLLMCVQGDGLHQRRNNNPQLENTQQSSGEYYQAEYAEGIPMTADSNIRQRLFPSRQRPGSVSQGMKGINSYPPSVAADDELESGEQQRTGRGYENTWPQENREVYREEEMPQESLYGYLNTPKKNGNYGSRKQDRMSTNPVVSIPQAGINGGTTTKQSTSTIYQSKMVDKGNESVGSSTLSQTTHSNMTNSSRNLSKQTAPNGTREEMYAQAIRSILSSIFDTYLNNATGMNNNDPASVVRVGRGKNILMLSTKNTSGVKTTDIISNENVTQININRYSTTNRTAETNITKRTGNTESSTKNIDTLTQKPTVVLSSETNSGTRHSSKPQINSTGTNKTIPTVQRGSFTVGTLGTNHTETVEGKRLSSGGGGETQKERFLGVTTSKADGQTVSDTVTVSKTNSTPSLSMNGTLGLPEMNGTEPATSVSAAIKTVSDGHYSVTSKQTQGLNHLDHTQNTTRSPIVLDSDRVGNIRQLGNDRNNKTEGPTSQPVIPPWIQKGPLIAKEVIINTLKHVKGDKKLKLKLLTALVEEMERNLLRVAGGVNPITRLQHALPSNIRNIINRVHRP